MLSKHRLLSSGLNTFLLESPSSVFVFFSLKDGFNMSRECSLQKVYTGDLCILCVYFVLIMFGSQETTIISRISTVCFVVLF